MAAVVHQSLQGRNLLPREHLVDKGYTDSQMLVDSEREYGVTIVGPVAEDPGWQARVAEWQKDKVERARRAEVAILVKERKVLMSLTTEFGNESRRCRACEARQAEPSKRRVVRALRTE
jgi:hypothetical protein